jgi:predicted GNAT superfamily acetyltransferase
MSSTTTPIEIREFGSLEEYDACVALQDDTWGHGFSERVPGAILRVAQKIGGVAAGGFDPDGRLLGFVFGMTGVRDGALVHWSDMLAVRPQARGSGLAEQLKQYQRTAVRALGVRTMLWTADPLVARNAHFNINRLGALPREYVPNMYGANTGSVLHGAMPTDRFVYHWDLDADHSQTAALPEGHSGAPAAISVSRDGTPVAVATPGAAVVCISVPQELTLVQAESSARALEWRMAVRTAFQRLADGFRVVGFVRPSTPGALPGYILAR